MPLRTALALSIVALAALPSAAGAAIAGPSQIEGSDIVFSAGPGEVNRLTVTGQGPTVIFEDAGASVTPGRTCTALAPNRVSCPRSTFVFVRLDDGDDEVTTAGELDQTLLFLEGDNGADTIHGEVGDTAIEGGTGNDRLFAGPLTSSVDAVDVVRRGEFQDVPDHNRERDDITCVQSTRTEPRTPLRVEIDVNDALSGPCPPVYLFFETFVVIEGTELADNLTSMLPPTRVNGLGGNDTLSGETDDRLDGGEGDDRLFGQGLLLGGSGNDVLDGGNSYSPPGGARLDGQSGDDEILGSRAGDSISGGAGRDVISGRRGRDSIRVRDGVRDSVTCGPDRDRVSADRGDSVSRDCEVVVRG